MSENSALNRVMAQAEDAARNYEGSGASSTALVPAASQALTAAGAPSRPSLQSMADSAGIQVDYFLQVKETGFRLGEMKGVFDSAKVRINMHEIVPIFSVRATNAAGQTTFIKSYDGVMTSQGQNFAQAEASLRSTHTKVDGPYQTAEIPVVLLESVTDGKVTVPANSRIGITPAITGVKFFTAFYNKLREQGLEKATVDVTITHKPQFSKKNGTEWGVVEFELIGPASE